MKPKIIALRKAVIDGQSVTIKVLEPAKSDQEQMLTSRPVRHVYQRHRRNEVARLSRSK